MKYIKKFENYVDIKVDRPEGDIKELIDGLKYDLNNILLPIKHKNTINIFDHFEPADESDDDWEYSLDIGISADGHLKEDRDLIEVVGDIMRYCELNLEENGFKCAVSTHYWDRLSQLTEMTKVVNPEELFKIDCWEDKTVDYIDMIIIKIKKV